MINYNRLSKAIAFYYLKGYDIIDLPWTVSEEAISITLPKGSVATRSDAGILVGSAEQSFLDKVLTENIRGKFQATTPCFRQEPVLDELHKSYFMKTELFYNAFQTMDELIYQLEFMIESATDFFTKFTDVKRIDTDKNCYDLICPITQIELGSYGIRYDKRIGFWVFGTGLAEPRLSTVLKKTIP